MHNTEYICAKCNSEGENYATVVVSHGIAAVFCKDCMDFIESSPPGTAWDIVNSRPVAETSVTRNMRMAREARDRGESIWNKK